METRRYDQRPTRPRDAHGLLLALRQWRHHLGLDDRATIGCLRDLVAGTVTGGRA